MEKSQNTPSGFWFNLHHKIDHLYHGNSQQADHFRWGLLVFDTLSIVYFIITTFYHRVDDFHFIETIIGVLYFLEFLARFLINPHRFRSLFSFVSLADLIVIISLLMPSLFQNYSFMRVVRALRLLRSYHMLKTLKNKSSFVSQHENVIFSVINLLVFIFVITAIVYVTQIHTNPQISNYFDALYFTVATLTTTGFGDVTLVGTEGHVLAVLIMIFGISLFLRLVQTIFRPAKIHYECPVCGLNHHDADAVHCKHCGEILNISIEGFD